MSVLINMSYPFYACKRMILNGKQFSSGQKVPVQKLGFPERKLVQLVKTRKLRQDFKTPLDDQVFEKPPVVVEEVPVVVEEAPVVVEEEAPKTRRGRKPKMTAELAEEEIQDLLSELETVIEEDSHDLDLLRGSDLIG